MRIERLMTQDIAIHHRHPSMTPVIASLKGVAISCLPSGQAELKTLEHHA
jgi:hypothetical protein